jgi:hypothetical protein
MNAARLFRHAVILVGLFLIAGCSVPGGPRTGSGDMATLIVENDLVPSVSLTIYAVSTGGGGIRTRVGSVNPGSTATLRFRPPGAGQHRFIADVMLGGEIVSNIVSVAPGETIEWNVRSNIATVAPPR